jgi:hypothetical protein
VQVGEEQLRAAERELTRPVRHVGLVQRPDAGPVSLDRELPVLAHLLDEPRQERRRVLEDLPGELRDRGALERPDHVRELLADASRVGACDGLELVFELRERRLGSGREEVGDVGVDLRGEPRRRNDREEDLEVAALDGLHGLLHPRQV